MQKIMNWRIDRNDVIIILLLATAIMLTLPGVISSISSNSSLALNQSDTIEIDGFLYLNLTGNQTTNVINGYGSGTINYTNTSIIISNESVYYVLNDSVESNYTVNNPTNLTGELIDINGSLYLNLTHPSDTDLVNNSITNSTENLTLTNFSTRNLTNAFETNNSINASTVNSSVSPDSNTINISGNIVNINGSVYINLTNEINQSIINQTGNKTNDSFDNISSIINITTNINITVNITTNSSLNLTNLSINQTNTSITNLTVTDQNLTLSNTTDSTLINFNSTDNESVISLQNMTSTNLTGSSGDVIIVNGSAYLNLTGNMTWNNAATIRKSFNITYEIRDSEGNIYQITGENDSVLETLADQYMIVDVVRKRIAEISMLDSKGVQQRGLAQMITEGIDNYSHKLEIEVENQSIKKIVFKNIRPEQFENKTLYIEQTNKTLKKGALTSYAIDPTDLNFTNATVTATATGRFLYKCKDYNFSTQTCFGNWTKIQAIVPGENYSFTLTPDDPAFTEFDYTFITDDAYTQSNRGTTTYNTGVLAVRDRSNRYYRTYMKWDISNLPSNIVITEATLHMNIASNGATASVQAYHVFDDTWDGQDETSLTHNNQVCGIAFDDATDCNLTAEDSQPTTSTGWVYFNVTDMLRYEVANGETELSIALKSPETASLTQDDFDSSEAASNQPILNISFNYYPNVTLRQPETATTSYEQKVNFEFNVTDDSTLLDCTLFGNFSGSWEPNVSVSSVLNDSNTNVPVTVQEGIFVWNVQCNDSEGLSSFASSNFTHTRTNPGVTANASVYIIDNTVQIDGSDWPSGANVTVNITDSTGTLVGGYPKTIICTGGTFTHYWSVPIVTPAGVYSILTYQTNNSDIYATDSFTVQNLTISNDRQNYIRTDIAYTFAGIFPAGASINITLYDPSLAFVSGYPKILIANSTGGINDSWTIPGGADLGTYTINTTQIGYLNRSRQKTFDVVTAIVETDNPTYEQGDTVAITGYNWNSDVDVTINITDPLGYGSYTPHNVTSNASGYIVDSWNIGYGASAGEYWVFGFEPIDTSKQDNVTFIVTERTVSLITEFDWYKSSENIEIFGTGFSPEANVTIDVFNSSGQSVGSYPKNVTSNSTGGITDSWTATYGLGNYTVNATDYLYNNLQSSAVIQQVRQTIDTKIYAFNSGETVNITGQYWDRGADVTIDIKNSSDVSASGYPKDVTADINGYLEEYWTAQPGAGTIETYNISAFQKLASAEADHVMIDVTKTATLTSDKSVYAAYENANLSGNYYSTSGNVKFWIKNTATSTKAFGYPIVESSDSIGDVYHIFYTGGYCPGNYYAEARDEDYPDQLFANHSFAIQYRNTDSYTSTEAFGFAASTWPPPEGDNTFDTCPDSVGGTDDEHVNEATLNMTVAGAGDDVLFSCDFDPFSTGTEEYMYYYNGTGWRQIYSGSGPSADPHTQSEVVTLDNYTGQHWFRCIADWDGEDDECADGGSYFDNDDVNLSVIQIPETCITFDSTRPNVTNIKVNESSTISGFSLNISAEVTDTNNLSYVAAVIDYPNGSSVTVQMLDHNLDNLFNVTFYDTYVVGAYNVTIWANDTWSNINDSEESNFSILYDPLEINTGRESYVRNETVNIYSGRFTAISNITLYVIDPLNDPVLGYPKFIMSNSSGWISDNWEIPEDAYLGVYTINTSQISDPDRNGTATFEVVTAVIQTNSPTYLQGNNVNISGTKWDPDENISLNITDPFGVVVYGPINLSSNSSGDLDDSWSLDYNAELGDYTLSAYQPSNPNKFDEYVFTVNQRIVSILIEYPWYKAKDALNYTVTGFSVDNNVTIDIYDSSYVSVTGYPNNMTANSTGGLNGSWNILVGTSVGEYTLNGTDILYNNLQQNATISIVSQNISTDLTAYKSGDTVFISGYYWDRDKNVTINIVNSSGHSASGYPKEVVVNPVGQITDSWVAQPGGSVGAEVYNITALQFEDNSENYSITVDVTLAASLNTLKPFYLPNTYVNITGSFYTASGNVKLWLRRLTDDGLAFEYPKIVQADSAGDITDAWDAANYCEGTYMVLSEDQTYPEQLNANTTFDISYEDITLQTCSNSFGADCSLWPDSSEGDNTYDACPSSVGGVDDEHVEDAFVNVTQSVPGRTVAFTCQFDPFSTGTEELMYYYNGTDWNQLYSASAPGADPHNQTVEVTLHDYVGQHWFRCIADWDGEDDECADGGQYYDNDDVNVSVMAEPGSCDTFDTIKPNVTELTPDNTSSPLGSPILITAKLLDNNAISYAKVSIIYPNSTVYNLTLTDDNADDTYNATFLETRIVGQYDYTIWVNDTWDNINDSESGTFNIYYVSLKVTTDQPNYIRGETATIFGTGFNSQVLVSIDIYNESNESMPSYPKEVLSNISGGITDTWAIGLAEQLGTYTVNATDTTNSSHSNSTTFEVVTAVVQTEFSDYEQGDTILLSGYSWDNSAEVTINITDSNSDTVYGPLNLTSNGSGNIYDEWNISFDAALGVYNITAIQPSNPGKNTTASFDVEGRTINISTQYSWYKVDEFVNITGIKYSPLTDITLDIYNSSGQSVATYPTTIPANISGGITNMWTIPSTQRLGTYTINSTDTAYTHLSNFTTIEIVTYNMSTDKIAYQSGDYVIITGAYWDRDRNVTVDIVNSSGSSIFGYPKNISVLASGNFTESWVAQPGGLSIAAYNITVFQIAEPSNTVTKQINVTRVATVNTDKISYLPNALVNITGSFYTALGEVSLNLKSLENNGNAEDYPIMFSADDYGNIQSLWNTSSFCSGEYNISTIDQSYPALLYGHTTFMILYNNPTPYNCTASFGADCSLWPDSSEGDNTFDACPSSVGGVDDEHVDAAILNMTVANPGDHVNFSCVFDPFSTGTEELMYYYNGASWVQLYSASAPGGSPHTQSVTVTIADNVGQQWFRCIADWDGEDDECADGGQYYDNDDVNISVVTPPGSCDEFDALAPTVSSVSPDNITGLENSLFQNINITAHITDNRIIKFVKAQVVSPNGTVINLTMTDDDTDDTFNASFVSPSQIGRYNITILAQDNSSNLNNSQQGWFRIIANTSMYAVEMNVPNMVFTENPTPLSQGGYVTAAVADFDVTIMNDMVIFANLNLKKESGTQNSDIWMRLLIDGAQIIEERIVINLSEQVSAGAKPKMISLSPGSHNITLQLNRSGDGEINATNIDIVLLQTISSRGQAVRHQQTETEYTHSSTTFDPSHSWSINKGTALNSSTYMTAWHQLTSTSKSYQDYYLDYGTDESPMYSGYLISSVDKLITLPGLYITSELGTHDRTVQSKSSAGTITSNITTIDFDLRDIQGNTINHFYSTNPSIDHVSNWTYPPGLSKVSSGTITLGNGTGVFLSMTASFSTATGLQIPEFFINSSSLGCILDREQYIESNLDVTSTYIYAVCTGGTVGTQYTIDFYINIPDGENLVMIDESFTGVEISTFAISERNLAPLVNTITFPLSDQMVKDTINITWNDFSDPNDDPVTYNLSLYTTTGVFDRLLNDSLQTTIQELNTKTITDGNWTLHLQACDPSDVCSTTNLNFTIHNYAPLVTNILPSAGTNFNVSQNVTISANITDAYGISKAYINISWADDHLTTNLTHIGDIYSFKFNQTSKSGRYNVSYWTNDSFNNINSTTLTYFHLLDFPNVKTDTNSYLRDETVKITAIGFNLYADVTIDIYNESNVSVLGFPQNFTTNSSGGFNLTWTVPSSQALGDYIINASDTTDTARQSNTTFAVVTAVVQTDASNYFQGDTVNITGYSWDFNVDVTINMTGPSSQVIVESYNVTSNDSGWIQSSWNIPYDADIGSYLIGAIQPSSPNRTDSEGFTILARETNVTANMSWYRIHQPVGVELLGFSPNNNITVNIYNSTNGSITTYPLNYTTNSTGGFNITWVFPDNQAHDNYSIYAQDTTYSNLNGTEIIEIASQNIALNGEAFNTGDTVHLSGSHWDRDKNVTLDIYNQSGISISGYPKNITTDKEGVWEDSWVAEREGTNTTTYNVTVYHPYDSIISDQTNFSVTVATTIVTEKKYFNINEDVRINGSYYTPEGNLLLTVFNSETGSWVEGFSNITDVDSNGDFFYTWNTIDYCEANYTISARDMTYPDVLFAQKNIEIDFYQDNTDDEPANSYVIYGNHNNFNTGIARTNTYNNDWLWFGSFDRIDEIIVESWINISFDISPTLLPVEKINSVNISMEYCHSGMQSSPSCSAGSPLEGIVNGDQQVQIFNFNTSDWEDLAVLPTDNTSDDEYNVSWVLDYPFAEFISNDQLKIRIEFNMTENSTEDDLLMIDYLNLNITYRDDVDFNCTLVDDIIGTENDVATTSGVDIEIEINDTDINYSSDYNAVQYIKIYNHSLPLVEFEYNFGLAPLNMSQITVLVEDASIGINITNAANITMHVPLVHEWCNVLVCEGVINGSDCDGTNNKTVYGYPQDGYCDLLVDGTWAQDASDQSDVMVNETSVNFSSWTPIENENITIYGTVQNIGNTIFPNITLQFYDLTSDVSIGGNFTLYNFSPTNVTTINTTWISSLGDHKIELQADIPIATDGQYTEVNESNNNASSVVNISTWGVVYGQVVGNISLATISDLLYLWSPEVPAGNMFIKDVDSDVDWHSLQAIGRTSSGGIAANDFVDIDTVLGTASFFDNITSKYSDDGSTPRLTDTFNISSNPIANVPIINSTNTSLFVTGILWDMSDSGDTEFDIAEGEDLVFVTHVNSEKLGSYGIYDYEVSVPVKLKEYKSGENKLSFYVEVR
ncbi:hypothetical protein K9M79_02380 [Candidatus Woesearchaeota archaeon]|nr:hypothetical protein [Candidatus Woesearchaeota archaeon]